MNRQLRKHYRLRNSTVKRRKRLHGSVRLQFSQGKMYVVLGPNVARNAKRSLTRVDSCMSFWRSMSAIGSEAATPAKPMLYNITIVYQPWWFYMHRFYHPAGSSAAHFAQTRDGSAPCSHCMQGAISARVELRLWKETPTVVLVISLYPLSNVLTCKTWKLSHITKH